MNNPKTLGTPKPGNYDPALVDRLNKQAAEEARQAMEEAARKKSEEKTASRKQGRADKTQPTPRGVFSIDDLVNRGKQFYSEEKDSAGRYVGDAVALKQAVAYAGSGGVVASLPYLVAGKASADKRNFLWKNWFTVLSEEDVGIDEKGVFVKAGSPIVVTLHGGGMLTPDRITRAYTEGLTPQNAAKFGDDEFDTLLKGILPSGESIPFYTVDEVKKGIPDPFGRYAVVMDLQTAKTNDSGQLEKNAFMENPLVIARAGLLTHLEAYFDKAQANGQVGYYHWLGEIDARQSQGRLLFVGRGNVGLSGAYSLNDRGRFVGVQAPEARSAKKQ